jgi:hypothetical protein
VKSLDSATKIRNKSKPAKDRSHAGGENDIDDIDIKDNNNNINDVDKSQASFAATEDDGRNSRGGRY